ncbi:MAG TPA: hypothetical protein PKM63_09185 [Panacibacter sp.]|nr:hypothetical protein [Panacibacter sp.]HNP44444.1 hypothetical protein [Panacibacter sp.]
MKKICSLLLFVSVILFSQAQPVVNDSIPKEIKSVTKHSVVIDGKTINYTATAGALILRNEKDEPVALIGYTAYTKDGETDLTKRPVTFAYNGGPGSSSYWLHMGIIGPRKVVLNDPYTVPPAPYKIEDNNNSILDISDIVMIDPVGTGLSHAVGKAKDKDFWGVDQDIKEVSGFIKTFITQNDRWNSPKYILGESYGTLRSGGVVNYLQERMSIAVNGVILVSSILNYSTQIFTDGSDIPYITFLPTYAATAWYHNKIANKPADLTAFLKDARAFASGDYAAALMKGASISDAEQEAVLNKLTYFTGLSKDYLLKANMRVKEVQFLQELLREDHKVLGRIDSRYTGISQDLLSEYAQTDAQGDAISPAFTAVFMNYYYGELKMDKNYTYKTNAYGNEGFDWDWKHGNSEAGGMPNTAADLSESMSHNPNLKVLSLNGYYDFATAFFATEYDIAHMNIDKKLRPNIIFKYYEAGHMMYINPKEAGAFKNDVNSFIKETSKVK